MPFSAAAAVSAGVTGSEETKATLLPSGDHSKELIFSGWRNSRPGLPPSGEICWIWLSLPSFPRNAIALPSGFQRRFESDSVFRISLGLPPDVGTVYNDM